MSSKPQVPPKAVVLNDVVSQITASTDEAGTHTISDGDTAELYGATATVWLHFKLKNNGPGEVKDFMARMVVKRDGQVVDSQEKLLTLAGGESKTYHVPVLCGEPLDKIEATLAADTNHVLHEPDTLGAVINNWASITFKVALYVSR